MRAGGRAPCIICQRGWRSTIGYIEEARSKARICFHFESTLSGRTDRCRSAPWPTNSEVASRPPRGRPRHGAWIAAGPLALPAAVNHRGSDIAACRARPPRPPDHPHAERLTTCVSYALVRAPLEPIPDTSNDESETVRRTKRWRSWAVAGTHRNFSPGSLPGHDSRARDERLPIRGCRELPPHSRALPTGCPGMSQRETPSQWRPFRMKLHGAPAGISSPYFSRAEPPV